MKDTNTNPFLDPGESPSDGVWPETMEDTEGGLYGRVKRSQLVGPLADSFTRAIDANRAAPGETGYGMHNLGNGFVVRLM